MPNVLVTPVGDTVPVTHSTITAIYASWEFNGCMNSEGVARIAVEICDLMQMQLDSIQRQKLSDFTPEELDAYQKRKSRIEELRSELHRLANPI